MKIILVGTAHPFRGGLAAFNGRLANQFLLGKNDIEIYTFTLQYPSILFPGKTQFSTDKKPNDVPTYRKINSVNPFNWVKVGKEIARKQPDLVIFCYWTSFIAPCFGTIARQLNKQKTKRIALLHNMIPHEPSLLDKIFPAYFTKPMDAYMTMAKPVLDDALRIDKKEKPWAISPHPIYDHYGESLSRKDALSFLKLDENYRYILFFGLIREYKGLDILLKAMAQENVKSQNIKLIVAGEFYSSAKSYKDIVEQEGILDKVIFFEKFIPDAEVRYYFSAADLIAQPYKTATQSGVTQVAYHFEKPMVVTNVGGLPEIVPHNKVGYVVETKPEEVAKAITDFYQAQKAEVFRPYILQEKEKYSWKKMTQKLINLYHKI